MYNFLIKYRLKQGTPATKYITVKSVSAKKAKQQFEDMYGQASFEILGVYKEVKSNV